jgi:hypothetical protein
VFGEDHPETLATRNTEGIIRLHRNRLDDAERIFNDVIARWRRKPGRPNPAILSPMLNLVEVHARRLEFDRGVAIAQEATELAIELFSPTHPRALLARKTLAMVLYDGGRLDEAIGEFEPLLKELRRVFGPAHVETERTVEILTSALMRKGRDADAETIHLDCAEALTTSPRPVPREAAVHLVFAAICAARDARRDVAMDHLRRAAELEVRVPPFAHHPAFEALREAPDFLALADRLEERR